MEWNQNFKMLKTTEFENSGTGKQLHNKLSKNFQRIKQDYFIKNKNKNNWFQHGIIKKS